MAVAFLGLVALEVSPIKRRFGGNKLDISSSVLLRARDLFWGALPDAITRDNIRPFIFGVTFAFLISPSSVLVLCFGLTGSPGNSLFTGGFLTISTVAVGLLCFRRDVVLV